MKKQLENAITNYVNAFEKKHEVEFLFFVNDDVIGVAFISDSFFNVSDIIYDIDNDCPKDLIWEWYDKTMEMGIEEKPTINYQSYAKGLRYDKLKK